MKHEFTSTGSLILIWRFYAIKTIRLVWATLYYWPRNKLLFKNPQFYPINTKLCRNTNKVHLRTSFWRSFVSNDWAKIVDFSIKAYFWFSTDSPGTHCNIYVMGVTKEVLHPVIFLICLTEPNVLLVFTTFNFILPKWSLSHHTQGKVLQCCHFQPTRIRWI